MKNKINIIIADGKVHSIITDIPGVTKDMFEFFNFDIDPEDMTEEEYCNTYNTLDKSVKKEKAKPGMKEIKF